MLAREIFVRLTSKSWSLYPCNLMLQHSPETTARGGYAPSRGEKGEDPAGHWVWAWIGVDVGGQGDVKRVEGWSKTQPFR